MGAAGAVDKPVRESESATVVEKEVGFPKARGPEAGVAGAPATLPVKPPVPETATPESSYSLSKDNEWRERALRLQAEMDNYRRRQRRAAQEAARLDQERLLDDVLGVADNLERTLAAGQPDPGAPDSGAIRQGVELTRDELMRVLLKHDVERFEAQGASFDPAWHEAVHVVPAVALGVEPGTVVQVVRSGYRRGERLLRPAQVVVAN
jgi:molecular chaperone GrpE